MVTKLADYQRAEKVNPYIADLKGFAVGDVFEEIVQTRVSDNTGKVLGLTGTKSNIQAAARANGFTARVIEEAELEDGKVRLVFQAYELQESGPRKPREKADKPAKA